MTSVIMVHGAFCGGWTFEAFRRPFEAAGYAVTAPDLRGHGSGAGSVSGVSMSDYADDIAALCRAQPEPPVLIGHSLGGLVALLAARRAPVRALALLAPSPPWGVPGSSLEEAATAFGVQFLGAIGALPPDRGLMRRYSLDRMPAEEREAVVARLCPESSLAIRETLNWWFDPFMTTSIAGAHLTMPRLVVSGDRDLVHAAATARATAGRIGADFRLMPGMSHWLVGEPGWDEVASLVLDWLSAEGRAAA